MIGTKKPEGVCLVIDPAAKSDLLYPKLMEALKAGVNIVQIWNNWPADSSLNNKLIFIAHILKMAEKHDVPVLINEEWQLLQTTNLHGVHFDNIPEDLQQIKTNIGREFIIGLTCGNDPEPIIWSEKHQVDYISFCSMFPSQSTSVCEIVRPESVLDARKITRIPIFLSGGINPDNLIKLHHLNFQGVAVISGIMEATSVTKSILAYKKALKNKI